MSRNFLTSSIQNASFNIILQLVVRGVTFVNNACVLRYISDDALGLMNVRLLLLESTILFLSREAFRRACLTRTTEHKWPQVINLMWLTTPMCIIFSTLFGYIWCYTFEAPPSHLQTQYVIGCWAIGISCVIEMLCEPLSLVTNAFLFNRLKVVLNMVHLLVRVGTFTPLVLYQPKMAVNAFSLAQVMASTAYVTGFYSYFRRYVKDKKPDEDFPFHSVRDFLPRLDQRPLLDWNLVTLTWSFFKVSAIKQILTEGERYVMTVFGVLSLAQQGVYDVVNSLGTLPARLLLRSLEESAYFYFSQLIARGKKIIEQPKEEMAEAAKTLHYALRCMVVLGLTVLVFGFSYSRLLLLLYGGENLSLGPGPTLLRAHCFAMLLLAINGITECFAHASMDNDQLDRYNYLMVILSGAFLFVSWGFTRLLGGVGFILANSCNMMARIGNSVYLIRGKYQGSEWNPLLGLIPGPATLIALFTSAVVTYTSEALYYDTSKVLHLAIGLSCFFGTVVTFALEEQELTSLFINRLRPSRPHEE